MCSFLVCWHLAKGPSRKEKPLRRGKKGPGRLIWKEIGNRCWDPGKWSWDEAGRTKKRERGARTRAQLILLAPVPVRAGCLSPPNIPSSKPGSHDVNTRPRSSSICHTHTHSSPARRSHPSLRTNGRNSRRPPSDLSVDPSSFFFFPFLGRRRPPFPRHRKSRPPPLHPPEENSAVVPIASVRPSLASTPRLV